MRYRILTQPGVEAARKALSDREKMPDLRGHEAIVGAGPQVDESDFEKLAQSIKREQDRLSASRRPPEEVDRMCFEMVHKVVPRDVLLCADARFWSRLAIVHLAEVIARRFPGRMGRTNLDNFGLGKRRECWPYKLWVRGELVFDEGAKDPYELGRVGSGDFWTSHVHRQNFMAVPQVFRAMVRLQYPARLKGKPLLFEGEENPEKGGYPGIRTLIKRLRENWATVEYLLLDERAVDGLLALHGEGLRRPDGTAAKIR